MTEEDKAKLPEYFNVLPFVFVGVWLNGKKHGKGRVVAANGSMFEGWWRNDIQDGLGILLHQDES